MARDLLPVLVNHAEQHEDFVPRDNPVARILCVPLTHFDRDRAATVLYGVLNATRRPGSPPFTDDDLEYLTRFAGQLSIAVANSVAFAAERERSEQLALVNAVLRESAALLSRERILETAVRRIQEAFQPLPRRDAGAGRRGVPAGLRRGPLRAGRGLGGLAARRGAAGPGAARARHRRRERGGARLRAAVAGGEERPGGADRVRRTRWPRCCTSRATGSFAFDRGQVITLQTLADGIGILLRNAELYATLEHTNARLVELDRTKSELVNVVAHDFRAPLAAILGWAELLAAGAESPPRSSAPARRRSSARPRAWRG